MCVDDILVGFETTKEKQSTTDFVVKLNSKFVIQTINLILAKDCAFRSLDVLLQ